MFDVKCHYGALHVCFIISDITWWNKFIAVKINETAGKRISLICIPSSVIHKHRGAETAQYRLQIIFKSLTVSSSLIFVPSFLIPNFAFPGKKTNHLFLFVPFRNESLIISKQTEALNVCQSDLLPFCQVNKHIYYKSFKHAHH